MSRYLARCDWLKDWSVVSPFRDRAVRRAVIHESTLIICNVYLMIIHRLIVIAEKDTVYKKFPIPLINRLEKHFLVLSTSLTNPQEKLVKTLQGWVQNFSSIEIPSYLGNRK